MAWVLGLPPEMRDTQANILMDIHVIVNWQLSNRVSTDQCHMTVLQGQVYNSLQWRAFFLQLSSCWFWLQAQVHNEKVL